MKTTKVYPLAAAGTLVLSVLSPSVFAEGPADLEALAEAARAAAAEEVKPAEKPAKPAKPKAAEAAKTEAAKTEAAKTEAGKAGQAVAEEKAPIDPAQRIAKLGLISQISADVSAVMTFTDGKRIWDEVQESELGSVLLELSAENDLDLTEAEGPGAMVASLFAEEFLFAIGEGAAQQVDNLYTLQSISDIYQMKVMVEAIAAGLDGGGMNNPFGHFQQAISENPDFLVNLVAALEMPPIVIAARVSDDEQREEFDGLLQGGSAMAMALAEEQGLTFLTSAEVEAGGMTLSGLALDGKGLMETLEEEVKVTEKLAELVGVAGAEDMVSSLAEKDLILVGAVSDDVIYLYLGSDAAKAPFAASPEESLAASDELAFVDPYLTKDLINVTWMSQELVESTVANQVYLQDYIKGFRMGLEGVEAFGNTKKLETLLGQVEALEKSYLKVNQYQPAASLSYLTGAGLFSEGFGGVLEGAYDWETPHQLGSVASSAFLTTQAISDKETLEMQNDYLEAVFASLYEASTLVSKMKETPSDLEEYKEAFELFDTKMKTDALAMWQGMQTMGAGLGQEYLFELDLAGSLPTVPEVPEVIIEEGVAPRLSLVMPVTDRAKLADSWKEMNSAAGKLLKTAGELADQEIPMQKPMSSKSDGLTTWFFPIPFQSDDFVPSVTLDDEVMVVSTSKERAVTLAEASKKKGEEVTGVVVEMNFAPLETFLTGWLELVGKNSEEILLDEDALEFFVENEELMKSLAKSMQEFESWKMHTRMEDGQLRSSSHFKTK